jgi:GTPase SAR1 family protein
VESSASMDNIRLMWLPELNEKAHGVPFIIVGTKCDLREDAALLKTKAEIGKPVRSFEENKAIAEELGAKGFLECSAFKKINISHVFEEAVRVARKDRELKEIKKAEEIAAAKNRRQSTHNRDGKSKGSASVNNAGVGGSLIPPNSNIDNSSGGSCCLIM